MKMAIDHTEERLMAPRSRQVVRSFGLFLPKSLRAKLSSAASGVIWLLGRHGLRLELAQLRQQSATLRVRVAELEGSLAQGEAELQKQELLTTTWTRACSLGSRGSTATFSNAMP